MSSFFRLEDGVYFPCRIVRFSEGKWVAFAPVALIQRLAIRSIKTLALYEIVFIVRQDVPSAQVKILADGYRSFIESQEGKVAKVEYCGLRTLAYKIRKNRKGHYVLMHVGMSPNVLAELERQMRLHEDILRFLTISIEALDEAPSVLAQTRAPRERTGTFQSGGSYESQAREPVSKPEIMADAVPEPIA